MFILFLRPGASGDRGVRDRCWVATPSLAAPDSGLQDSPGSVTNPGDPHHEAGLHSRTPGCRGRYPPDPSGANRAEVKAGVSGFPESASKDRRARRSKPTGKNSSCRKFTIGMERRERKRPTPTAGGGSCSRAQGIGTWSDRILWREFARWLRTIFPGMPIAFIPASEPFRAVRFKCATTLRGLVS
jgi:hypothetical protein